jgi:Leucine-rich repeat (LRR) protein
VIFVNATLPVFPTNLFDQLPALSNVTASRAGIRNISSLGGQTAKKVENMRTLILVQNELTTLGTKAFYRLYKLTFLDVSFNRITDIEKDAFNGLSSLNQLILNGNLLQTLTDGVFSSLGSLKKIQIDRNQLTELDLDQFSELRNALSISAKRNEIETILADNENRWMNTLYLGGNRLEDISNLTRLLGLKTLYLDSNPLILDGEFFENMPQLAELVLDDINLSQLDGNFTIFAALQSLTLLSLSNNSLGTFEVAKFPKLPKLNHLFLDGNNLTALDFENFNTIFPKLEAIEITNNRFECVFLKFMLEHFERTKVRLEFYNKPKTASRFSVQGVECVIHSGDAIKDLSTRLDTMMAVFSDIDRTANETVAYLETVISQLNDVMEEQFQELRSIGSQKFELLEDNSTHVQRQLNGLRLRLQVLEDRAKMDDESITSTLLWVTAILGLFISSVLAGFYVFGQIQTGRGGTDKLHVAYSRRNSQYESPTIL